MPPTAADIIGANSSNLLREDDIIISEVKVDHTKGDENPMYNVSFFDYPESTEKRKVSPHQISTMFPGCNRVRRHPFFATSQTTTFQGSSALWTLVMYRESVRHATFMHKAQVSMPESDCHTEPLLELIAPVCQEGVGFTSNTVTSQ